MQAAPPQSTIPWEAMNKTRLETFTDGVIAILMTILILDVKTPVGASLTDLWSTSPQFEAYGLSFVFLAIYWNNHHHVLHATSRIDGVVLWANMLLLFWLSLVPFTTSWMGESNIAQVPTAVYGINLLLAAFAFTFLTRAIIRCEGPQSKLLVAVGRNRKARVSQLLYATGIGMCFVRPWVAAGLYALVSIIWIVPDPRIERGL
jgi:uncharacterized membrane protein